MEPVAIALVLLGVLAMAAHATLQRWLLRERIISVNTALVAQSGISAIFLFSAMWWWGGWGTSFSYNAQAFWLAVAGTTAANIFIQFANARSRELADVSLTAPIQAMTPGLVVIAALTLGELPSWQGIAGIVCIMVGTYVHTRENATTLREYLKPFTMFALPRNFGELPPSEQRKTRQARTALAWAYISAGLGTIGLIGDGLVARNGDVGLGFGVQMLILTLCFSMFSALQKNPREKKEPAVRIKIQPWGPVTLMGLFYGLHVIFVMTAFRVAPIAYIGSLKRLSIIITILLAWFFLHEVKAKRRLWPAAAITLGAMLLAFDGSIGAVIERTQQLIQ